MSRRKRGAIFALAGIFVAAAAAWLAGSERSLTERSERLPGAANGSELRRTHWTETAVVLPDGRRRIEVAGGKSGGAFLLLKSDDAPYSNGIVVDAPTAARTLLGVTPQNRLLAVGDRAGRR